MIAWPQGSLSQNVTSIGRLPVYGLHMRMYAVYKKQGIVEKG